MAQSDLIHHKTLHRYAVTLLQIRILIPISDDICVQKSIQLIIQTALIRKIHQYHLGDLDALLDIPILVKFERHHIIFIQSCDSHRMFHSERIPRIILGSFLIPHDQNMADGGDCLRRLIRPVHLAQDPEQQ